MHNQAQNHHHLLFGTFQGGARCSSTSNPYLEFSFRINVGIPILSTMHNRNKQNREARL